MQGGGANVAKPSKSKDEVLEEYFKIFERGDEREDSGKFEEAGDAYYEGAELADIHNLDSMRVIAGYDQSAQCFMKIKSNKTFECFRKAIDVFIKHKKIHEAIEFCVDYGYKCQTVMGDASQSEYFYNKSDQLRLEYDISHTCVITKFDPGEFKGDIKEAIKLKKSFMFQKREGGCSKNTHLSICRICIGAYEELCRFIRDS
ncbi:hypothetical protein RF11_08331 [Thelohanellus kitauei]|uniref:Alpha-soluble NSF attachment protein n=1 Tax=Thelohanellus kitauei TaxID=669202 RepID=A0A0C2IYB3_THEKT|nr:hypothetical protein RF11_08331 [Thelohanellus kitauei]